MVQKACWREEEGVAVMRGLCEGIDGGAGEVSVGGKGHLVEEPGSEEPSETAQAQTHFESNARP